MDVVKLALNPSEGTCYSAYDDKHDTYVGPPGRGIYMTQDLERRLNFTTQLVFASSKGSRREFFNETTGKRQTTWTGMVGMLVRGEADWSPCSLYQTLARVKVIDFSPTPYGIGELVTMAHIPHEDDDSGYGPHYRYDSVLNPFHITVWRCLYASLLIYGICMARIEMISQRNDPKQRCRPLWYILMIKLLDLLKPLVTETYDVTGWRRPNLSFCSKLVVACWMYVVMVLYIEYSDELTSFLSTHDSLDWITGWDDLTERILDGKVTCYIYGEGFLRNDAELYFGRDVSQRLEYCNTKMACLDIMLADRDRRLTVWSEMSVDAYLLMSTSGVHSLPGKPAKKQFDQNAELYVVGAGQGRGLAMAGLIFSRHRPEILRQFQPWIEQYDQLGFMQYWKSKAQMDVKAFKMAAIKRHKSMTVTKVETDHEAWNGDLSVADMAGAFIAYDAFLCIACLVMVMEKSFTAVRRWKTSMKDAKSKSVIQKISADAESQRRVSAVTLFTKLDNVKSRDHNMTQHRA